MKKVLLALFLSMFVSISLFAKSQSYFSITTEGRFSSLNSEIIPGATISFGIGSDESFTWNAYLKGEYPFSPLGSKNCGVATLEYFVEAGVGMVHPIYNVKDFNKVNIALDLGYYVQGIHALGYTNSTAGYNGLVARGKISYLIAKIFSIPFEIGCQYQFSVYPVYDRYTGLGLFVKI